MIAGKDFTLFRTGRGLAASRHPFGDARLPVRHCAARAEVPPCRQTTQPKNEVLTSIRDLTISTCIISTISVSFVCVCLIVSFFCGY